MIDKTSVRVTAIASILAVVILTVGVAGFAVAYPNYSQPAQRDASQPANYATSYATVTLALTSTSPGITFMAESSASIAMPVS